MFLHRRAFGIVGIAALVIACPFLTPGPVAQEECEATVDARLESTEEGTQVTEYRFRVDVTVNNDCAHVEYDLIVNELLPNGQTKKIRKPGFAKLDDGSFSAVVHHTQSSDLEMTGFEAKVVSCRVCSIMP